MAGLCEAISYLVLLGIAMPLKYLAGLPEVVLVVGWIHGVLFIAFAAATFFAWGTGHITARLVGLAAIAALVPFGPFFISRELNIFASHPDETVPGPATKTTDSAYTSNRMK